MAFDKQFSFIFFCFFVEVATKKNVTIRKVTRGSPDSDDSFADESPDGYLRGRDDQFLVSDRSENKFYGSVHGAPTGNAMPFDNLGLGIVGRKLEEYAYLCPGLFPWVNPGPATHESGKKFCLIQNKTTKKPKYLIAFYLILGMHVTKLVGIMFGLIFLLDLLAACSFSGTLAGLIFTILIVSIITILMIISRQPQNRYALAFLTPGLPFIPAIAITVNIYLIFKLSILTLVRFTIWMILGLIMYFYYGITHSSLENAQEEFEMTVDQPITLNVPQPKQNNHHNQPTAVWDRHGYENKMADDTWSSGNNYNSWNIDEVNNAWNESATGTTIKSSITTTAPGSGSASVQSKNRPPPPPPPKSNTKRQNKSSHTQKSTTQQQQQQPKNGGGFGSIFVDETQFPSWDD